MDNIPGSQANNDNGFDDWGESSNKPSKKQKEEV